MEAERKNSIPALQEILTEATSPSPSNLHQILEVALSCARMCAWSADMVTNESTYLGDPLPIFGCVPAAKFEEGFGKLVHPDDLEKVMRNISRLAESHEPYEEEFRVLRPDGCIRWVYARGRFFYDAEGHAVRLVGVNVDVTQEKRTAGELADARNSLQQKNALLDTIVHNIPAMICYMREPGKVHWVNRSWERILGWSPEDNGGEIAALMYPDAAELQRVREFIARADGTLGEFKSRTKSGRVIDTAWVNVALPDGVNIGIGRDISEQKKTDSELRESERRFRTLSDNIPQQIWITNDKGANTYYNHRWYDFTGQTPEDAAGFGWRDVMHPDEVEANATLWAKANSEGTAFENELRLRRHDGEFRWFLVRAVPVRDDSGNVVQWFGTNTDITEKKLGQEALIRSEKLAMAGRFAATVAHEVNNPLTAVTNIHYLLAADETVPAHIREALRAADNELRRVSHILRQTLAFYREQTRHEAVQISDLTDEISAMFAARFESRRIRFGVGVPRDLAAWASGGEVRQVLCNLVANALDAVPTGGNIEMRGRVVSRSGGPAVRIVVADDGHGIPRENAARIFEPFFTTKNELGTGLGLWITQQLVERNGGRLRMRSRPGRGTVFALEFPAALMAPGAAMPGAAARSVSTAGWPATAQAN